MASSPAEVYQEFFVPAVFDPWARVLTDVARPGRGERVLDLACGTGVLARLIAPMVGPEGTVTGLDLRPGMLAVARTLPDPGGAPIDWVEGDATAMSLDDAGFDLVVCQQGLQFFPNKPAAAAEMRRVLVPGGRLVASVWQDLENLELFHSLTVAEARHLLPLGVSYQDVAAPFLYGDPGVLAELFENAGFVDVKVEPRSLEVRFPDADRFVEDVEYGYSSMVPALSEDPRRFAAFVEAVTHDISDDIEHYRHGDEIRFTLRSNIVEARK